VANQCFKELWERTTKVLLALSTLNFISLFVCFAMVQINDIIQATPFSNDLQLLTLMQMCLQVDGKQRPSALQAQKYLVT